LIDVQAEQGFVDFRGHGIFYRIVGIEEEPARLPLVCLSGGPGIPFDYLKPLECLAEGRRVVFYDQLGSGRSDRPSDPAMWTTELFLEEHRDVMASLGLESYHLLGQSWGGMLALEHTLTDAGDVTSLVLASAPCSIPQWASEANRLRELLPDEVQEILTRHEEAGTTDSDEYEEAMLVFYQRHVCRLDPWPDFIAEAFAELNQEVYNTMFGPSEFYVTGTLKEWDVTGRLGEISVPVLITTGWFDEATPEIGKTLNQGIPRSQWVMFDESSHSAHAEQQKDYALTVSRFLEQVEQGLR
jgi:proline-specific peptidase